MTEAKQHIKDFWSFDRFDPEVPAPVPAQTQPGFDQKFRDHPVTCLIDEVIQVGKQLTIVNKQKTSSPGALSRTALASSSAPASSSNAPPRGPQESASHTAEHEHEASGKKRRRSESRPPRHNSSSSSSPESPVPSDEPSDAEDGLSAEPAESKPKRARGDAEGRSPESGESAPGGASAGSVRPSRPGGGSFSPQGAVPAMPSSSETLHLQQSHRPHPDDARPESVGNPPSVGDRLPFQSSSVHLSSSGGRGSPSGAREATESLKDSAEESLLPGDVVGSPQQQEQGQGVEKGALGCYSQGQDSR